MTDKMSAPGSYLARRKDGTEYFRASITYKDRHISLGSFADDKQAGEAYSVANLILNGERVPEPEEYEQLGHPLSFTRWIVLLNLKKTGIYCKNPILLYGKYFLYYLDSKTVLKFDVDDMFFYRTHRIQKRGNHLFYSDYGMQTGVLSRYGVRGFAVKGRDYYFKNGDENDYTYGNIVIVNKYNGVRRCQYRGRYVYEVKIHMLGNVTVGRYSRETEAAIAYNKAADQIEEKIRARQNEDQKYPEYMDCVGDRAAIQDSVFYDDRKEKMQEPYNEAQEVVLPTNQKCSKYRNWRRNYIEEISNSEYINIYERIKFTKSFRKYLNEL